MFAVCVIGASDAIQLGELDPASCTEMAIFSLIVVVSFFVFSLHDINLKSQSGDDGSKRASDAFFTPS